MRVSIDARMISHPGIGRYIRNLLIGMEKISADNEFILYGDTEVLSDFKRFKAKQYKRSIYGIGDILSNPFVNDNPDVIHIPHFNAPFRKIDNLVITIHDLIYLKFSESRPFLKGLAAKPLIAHAVRKAAKIIAISENTKKDIIENFPQAQGKVSVVYEAADPAFAKIEERDLKQTVLQRYGLPEDTILFVGSLKKHKNIERLIDAYNLLKSRGIRHRLVIVGRYRPREAFILKKIRTTDALYLGEIPTKDLAVIYNLATLLVFPSLYEGFGLPILEAMASGLPVVASNASSLPEVAGDAAVLVDPNNTQKLSDAIYNVLNDGKLRAELVMKGLGRARLFSWIDTAVRTLKIYQEVAT